MLRYDVIVNDEAWISTLSAEKAEAYAALVDGKIRVFDVTYVPTSDFTLPSPKKPAYVSLKMVASLAAKLGYKNLDVVAHIAPSGKNAGFKIVSNNGIILGIGKTRLACQKDALAYLQAEDEVVFLEDMITSSPLKNEAYERFTRKCACGASRKYVCDDFAKCLSCHKPLTIEAS